MLATMDEQGILQPLEEGVFGSALAGAMLLELAFANRIDTDLGTLFVIDPSPTDDPAQDRVLAQIAARAEPVDARWWIRELAGDAGMLADAALAGLVRRGVVASPPRRRFGGARLRRLEVIDAEPRRQVANRLKATLSASDAPHPREAASVALLDACGLLANILPATDIRRERIEQLTGEVEIGQEFTGKVVRIMDFGAFVGILPNKDGLVHISQISEHRVKSVDAVLSEGQMVRVKVLDVDKLGRIKLSMKGLEQPAEAA